MDTLLHRADIQADERAWLVNYCTRLCSDRALADDLAQETLLAAWQSAQRAPLAVERRAWLAGIAQNMYRRWRRRHNLEQRHSLPLDEDDALALADETLEYDLDRQTLAELLERALALLPPPTRAALIAHYIEEQPQAEIAQRLGLSEGAVAVRLHRGRLTLARLLATDHPALLREYGLGAPRQPNWETTSLWCIICGRRHLEGIFDANHTSLRLCCPDCGELMNHGVAVGGARTFGAAVNRINRYLQGYYLPAASNGTAICFGCGQTVPMQVETLRTDAIQVPGLVAHCPCQVLNTCGAFLLALLSPPGWAFSQANRRIRFEGMQPIEAAGALANAFTFASLTSADRFTAVLDQQTLRWLPSTAGG